MKNFTEKQLTVLLGSIHTEISYLKERLQLLESLLEQFTEDSPKLVSNTKTQPTSDALLENIIATLPELQYISASLLQRKFSIGYARAGRMLDLLEREGYVSKADGAKPRKVLKK